MINHIGNFGLSGNPYMLSLVSRDNGNIVIDVARSGNNANDPICIAGFLYTKGGMIDLGTAKNNVNADVFFVGARTSKTLDNSHFNSGQNMIFYLLDQRMPAGRLKQTGIHTNLLSNNGSGWQFVLDLYWTERNF
jgi:hypothetical protein